MCGLIALLLMCIRVGLGAWSPEMSARGGEGQNSINRPGPKPLRTKVMKSFTHTNNTINGLSNTVRVESHNILLQSLFWEGR